MNTKRARRVVGELLFWGVVIAFLVFATSRLRSVERERRVTDLEIIITDSEAKSFITADSVTTLLRESGLYPVGQRVDSISLKDIKELVGRLDYATNVETHINFDGRLTISLAQHSPYVRIYTDNGYDFYLSEGLVVLPIQDHKVLNLPIVTGTLPLHFDRDFTGDVRDVPSEGEKNYEENCNFLSKLINFVNLTENSPKYRGEIVQIRATTRSQSATEGWQEPTFEIVPRKGDYVVEIGTLESVEVKLDKWLKFAEARVVELSDGVLNVEYESQAVWKDLNHNTKKSKKR